MYPLTTHPKNFNKTRRKPFVLYSLAWLAPSRSSDSRPLAVRWNFPNCKASGAKAQKGPFPRSPSARIPPVIRHRFVTLRTLHFCSQGISDITTPAAYLAHAFGAIRVSVGKLGWYSLHRVLDPITRTWLILSNWN